jgi:hypothetical protein
MQYWLLFLKVWDLVGAAAYTLVFALFESTVVLLLCIILAAALPASLFRVKFVAYSSGLVLVTSMWMLAHQRGLIRLFASLLWPALYLVSVGAVYVIIRRFGLVERFLNALAERLTVFLYLYVPAALLSIVIVIARNL